jgi:PAS domain S-box-containing protein
MADRAETRREFAADRYARLYARAPVACLALDPSGVIREANHAAAALLRTSESALVGQPLFRFVTVQQQVLLRNHFRTLTETCERQATDLSLRVPESVHPIVVQIVSRMASDDIPEVVSVLVDITERRRAEMVLDFLDNAGQALSTVATTAAVVQQIPELAVPLLGDLCVVEFRDVANVMRKVKQQHKSVKGIALSGFGAQEDVRRAKQAGFTAHLTKPISFPRLESLIRDIAG